MEGSEPSEGCGRRLFDSIHSCLFERITKNNIIQFFPQVYRRLSVCTTCRLYIIWIPKFGGEMASLQSEKKKRQNK